MKKSVFLIMILTVLFLSIPEMVCSQQEEKASPPVAQPIVREGDLAVKLVFALGLSPTEDEVEAETSLARAGVGPQNGWIADYPVTPDIIGEIQESIGDAVGSGRLKMSRDEALSRFQDTAFALGLAVRPAAGIQSPGRSEPESYTGTSVINNYFYDQGPPVVTYYRPPADFYYLYSWVPYPFWWGDIRFSGFFILRDFDRVIVVNRRPVIVTNHFRDIRRHRVFRIDPETRFHGRTFPGIGAHKKRNFISTGVPRSDRRIFNQRSRDGGHGRDSGGRGRR